LHLHENFIRELPLEKEVITESQPDPDPDLGISWRNFTTVG